MQRKNRPVEYHIAAAGGATVFMHPIRVGLNRAAYHNGPLNTFHLSALSTLKDTWTYLFKGCTFNIIRGSMSSGLQAYANQEARDYYGENLFGKLAGLITASVVGTAIASFFETPFMRRNAGADLKLSALFRLNKPITAFFFAREVGFSSAVLAANDYPKFGYYTILATAAWGSAICHKFLMIETTKDLGKQYTTPDYSKGFRHTLSELARGAYTHPSLTVAYKNPSSFFQRSANVLYATSGLNMFTFRLLYFAGFKISLDITRDYLNNRQNKDTIVPTISMKPQ